MASKSQRSFASGELSPSLHSRVDFFKYSTGLKTCLNGIVMRHGGWANRPGSLFVGETKPEGSRLAPFIYNPSLAYVLEFTDQKMKVIKDGEYLKHNAFTISGYYDGWADPTLLTDSDQISEGDTFYIDSTSDAPKNMAGRTFIAGPVQYIPVGSSSYYSVKVKMMDGTMGDKAYLFEGYDPLTGTGSGSMIYEVDTPYVSSELSDLQYVQSGVTMTLVHKSHDPKNLSFVSETNWALSDLVFAPTISRPTSVYVGGGPAGTEVHKYIITAIKEGTYEESVPGIAQFTEEVTAGSNGAAITLSNPQEIIVPSGHGLEVGDKVYLDLDANSVIKGLKDAAITIIATSSERIYLNFDGTKYADLGPFTYKTGDKITPAFAKFTGGTPSASDPIRVRWSRVDGAIEYNIYKESNGVFGLIGIAEGDTMLDIGVSPDTSTTPPTGTNPFAAPGDKPGTAAYIQQRLALGNTSNDPQKIIASRTGEVSNFNQSRPIQDDDSFRFTIAGRQQNEVNHMLDLGKFVILTSGGEWSAEGDGAGIIRPTAINLRQHSYNGSNKLSPLVVDGSALYVQSRGSIIRDLGFSYQVDGYQGNDLTIFSSHLFDNYTLIDWAYQQTPNSIVWAVRDDGTLLGLTLVREQQLLAWHRHTFQGGKVKAIASIPNGAEDEIYLSIEREVNGSTVRYVERLSTRKVVEVEDCIFMDSAVSYDGRNSNTNLQMTISQINTDGYEYGTEMTLTASSAYFTTDGSSNGNEVWVEDPGGNVFKCTLSTPVSTTQYKVVANKDIPVSLQNVATASWSFAVSEITGLGHLEGEKIVILSDGNVVASPNNDDYGIITVTGGKVTLPRPGAVVHVGLPYMSDLETLNIDTAQGESLASKKINIQSAVAFIEKSRGMWIGTKPPSDDTVDPLEGLQEAKITTEETYASGALITGKVEENLESDWNNNGRVFIRQVDPLPLTVLSIFPEGFIPYR